MIKVPAGNKVQLEEGRFATITEEGTLIIEYASGGPLGQERMRVVGISTVGSQALLDLLANGETVEHSVQSDVCLLGGSHEWVTKSNGEYTKTFCGKCGTRR